MNANVKSKVRAIQEHSAYELSIGFIAILFVINLILHFQGSDWPHHRLVDWIIYAVFVLDYVVGFWAAEKKWPFVKSHWIQLISIIPFSEFFQSARLLQLIQFFRALIAFKRAIIHLNDAFARFEFMSTFVVTIILVTGMGTFVYLIEPETFKGSFGNSVWWAAVTATTVGYGDFFPTTTVGRIFAVILMLIGTAFVGVLSGILASYYVRKRDNEQSDPWKDAMIEQIERLEKLDDGERARLIRMIETYQEDSSESDKKRVDIS